MHQLAVRPEKWNPFLPHAPRHGPQLAQASHVHSVSLTSDWFSLAHMTSFSAVSEKPQSRDIIELARLDHLCLDFLWEIQ